MTFIEAYHRVREWFSVVVLRRRTTTRIIRPDENESRSFREHSAKQFIPLESKAQEQSVPKPPAPPPGPVPEPPPTPPVPSPQPPPTPLGNRKQRRAQLSWERERRKRDKFVTPKGPTPVSIPRGPQAKREMPLPSPTLEPKSANVLIEGDDGTCYEESELYGVFNFRDTILDQLDRYWVYLRRMKATAPDSYGFYKQVGAQIVPLMTWLLQDGIDDKDERPMKPLKPLAPLSPWWRTHRPMFGCVSYGISSGIERQEIEHTQARKAKGDHRELWVPKFMYFIKYVQPPPTVQPTSGGDVYAMTVWWDRPHDPTTAKKMKGGAPSEYAVFVSADGNDVHALPMLKTSMIHMMPKRRSKKVEDWSYYIPQRAWGIPKEYRAWAKDSGEEVNHFLSRLFIEAAHVIERASFSMVRVAVTHDDLTAVFGVDVKRIPYFFQDRDITLTVKGVKQRIFHIVRPHTRKDGTGVPFHFRGLREFEWAGYHVSITVPGRDHLLLPELDVGVSDEYWADKKDMKDWAHMPELGAKLANYIKEGRGGRH